MILKTLRTIWLLLMLLSVAWFGWYLVGVPINNMIPRPLGDKLVYLGKQDYGGPFGDSDPASTYYYGTDLEPAEMKNVFNAQYSPFDALAFKNAAFTSSDGEFMFTYEKTRLFTTSKKYIVSIGNTAYTIAKKHLK